MAELSVGDVGVELRVNTGMDLTDSTVRQIKMKRPGGSVVTIPGTSVSGSTIICKTRNGDLNSAGTYVIAAYVEFANGDKYTGKGAFLSVNAF